MAGTHSLLAPSGAKTWARCAGSLLLSKNIAGTTSKDAASGTCTHWLSEQLFKHGTQPESFLAKELEHDGHRFIIEQDRCDRVHAYVTAVLREPGQRFIEHHLDTSAILGVPNQSGHADVVTLDPTGVVLIDGTEYKGVLSVHDLKDGHEVIWAKDNLQGLIYAAAALHKFDLTADFNAVRFCIHQPRERHYDEWAYTRDEIASFVAAIRPVAKLVYDLFHGNVDFDPMVHLNAGESQCQWCPARGGCPARARRIVSMFETLAARHEIDDETLSQIYIRLDEIESACNDFRAEAVRRATRGHTITGQKVVRGKQGARQWRDPARAVETLQLLVEDEALYAPREVKSPTQIEALVGKKKFTGMTQIHKLITRSEGSLSLAPLDDPRPAVKIETFDVIPETESLI